MSRLFTLKNDMKTPIITTKHALIVSKNSDITEEFARMAANDGKHLILVDADENKLVSARKRLTSNYPNLQVKTINEQLSGIGSAENITDSARFFQLLSPDPVSLDLVINIIEFDTIDLDDEKVWEDEGNSSKLDIFTLMELNEKFARIMKQQGKGEILNVLTGNPQMSDLVREMYRETENLMMDFSQKLNESVQGSGISVHALSYSGTGLIFLSPDATGSPAPGQASSHSMGYVQTLLASMSP